MKKYKTLCGRPVRDFSRVLRPKDYKDCVEKYSHSSPTRYGWMIYFRFGDAMRFSQMLLSEGGVYVLNPRYKHWNYVLYGDDAALQGKFFELALFGHENNSGEDKTV